VIKNPSKITYFIIEFKNKNKILFLAKRLMNFPFFIYFYFSGEKKNPEEFSIFLVFYFSFWRKGCSSALALEICLQVTTELEIWGRRGRQTSKSKEKQNSAQLHIVESLPVPSLYEQERARHTSRQKKDRQRGACTKL
jgi:hypothetical protein